MVAAETLQTLHRIHIQISDLRSRLERGPRVVAVAQTTVDNAQTTLEAQREAMKRARMASDEKQLQLKEREARVKDLDSKLGACSSNREFQALKEQIAADVQANSVLEDEILEAMEKLDEMAEQIRQQEQTLANAQQELDQVEGRVADEREGLDWGEWRPSWWKSNPHSRPTSAMNTNASRMSAGKRPWRPSKASSAAAATRNSTRRS